MVILLSENKESGGHFVKQADLSVLVKTWKAVLINGVLLLLT